MGGSVLVPSQDAKKVITSAAILSAACLLSMQHLGGMVQLKVAISHI